MLKRLPILLLALLLAACDDLTAPSLDKEIHLPPYDPSVAHGIWVGVNYVHSITFYAPPGLVPELEVSSSAPTRLVITNRPLPVMLPCESPCTRRPWRYSVEFRAEVPLDETITTFVKKNPEEKTSFRVVTNEKG